jgi:miniconductance mechanosensitive channel
MFDLWSEWVASWGLSDLATTALTQLGAALIIVLLSVIVNWVAKRILLAGLRRIIRATTVTWDDVFLEAHIFDRLSHLAPAMVIYFLGPLAFAGQPAFVTFAQRIALVYMLVMGMLVIDAFLNALVNLYRRTEISRHKPIKGYVQVIKLIVYLALGIVIFSTLLGRSPLVMLSGLGAMTAVLLLVFKDTILAFVASIQISANDMVRPGDWISMPKYGADGDVIDLTLNTIKVQNWDKTVTTIPTYALISDSFKNWRGMEESGGRRIKRALHIDMNTIRFMDTEDLKRFKSFRLLADYIAAKEGDLAETNTAPGDDVPANSRRLTNIGTFRAYVVAYLRVHPMVHDGMTFLVRQLAPSENGLPLEIYVFSRDQEWANYEGIQSDIFDHVLAVVPEFGLRVFQRPSGVDFQALGANSGGSKP